ncbi:ABC transporter [Acrocarpospora corrugata]|uniref:ABC transporter n=1 Tax=Acrocarpospora corrugata TaxID=35763 RepID=A0A5M3WB02_9ACTN|nr:ATP-binding cassette domain-containing protein [Acrocarpospora corrugata]GES04231.1 ABC transporter [Acrocarpospora corrugata]
MSEALIEATGLEKTYPARNRQGTPFRAVAGVAFRVHRGEAFGFLGPNGAGKSSTMRMLAGVSAPTAGTLRILGLDPVADGRRVRARLGVVPQDDSLDTQLTVEENLLVYGLYFGLSRRAVRTKAGELLAFARLEDKAGERVENLSGGMRRRLTIARALINDPEILLLDEPTTGLDPQARHVLWERLFRLKQDGVTLILTTHYMDEAEQLCDRLVVMDKGLIADGGSPRELIERHVTREVLELRFPPGEHEKIGRELGEQVEVLPDRLLWYADDGEQALARATELGIRPLTALVRRAGLEDVFLRLTGRSLTD